MNSHGHDERLSAFYDGELPAVERAEVERLLSEHPELQAELAGMTDLSQRLSDLADDGAHFDLRAGVMEAIRSGVGRRESGAGPETRDERREPVVRSSEGPLVDQPSTINHQPPSARRWMPLVLMTCSLALLVAAILPLTMKPDQSLVASNDAVTDSPFAPESTPAPMVAPALAESAVAFEANGNVDNGPAMAMQTAPDAAVMSGLGGGANDDSDPSELLRSLAEKGRLNPGELITQLIEIGGEAMLAEYQVVDVRRSFSQVEVLLKDKGIVPLASEPERAESDSTDTKSDQWEMRAILIDAEPTPLNEALVQFDSSPDNLGVMVTHLDAATLLQEVQELDPPNDALAKAGDVPPPPAPAPVFGGALKGAGGPPQAEVRSSQMMQRNMAMEKSVAGKMRPARKFEAPAVVASPQLPRDTDPAPGALPPVMGNSVVISNADEVYPALEVAARNSYNSRQNALNQTNRRAGPRAAGQELVQQHANPIDQLSQIGQNASRTPDLQYSQRSTNRMRQLAILVLRPKPMTEQKPKTP